MNEGMDERDVVRRWCAVCAVIIALFGTGVALYVFTGPAGMFSGLRPVLAAIVLALTNLLCLPLVLGYWIAAFRPKGARTLLILQGVGMGVFLVWYGFMLT